MQKNTQNLKNIILLGPVTEEDKAALLSLCLTFVFPSDNRAEAFGLSLLEAAMFAKPLITCDIESGTSYVNQHKKTGLIVPPKDPKALAQALEFFWDNPDNAKNMGKAARKRYEQFFMAKTMAHAYLSLYKQLVS